MEIWQTTNVLDKPFHKHNGSENESGKFPSWYEDFKANVFDVKRQIYYVLDCRFQCLALNVGI